MAAVAAIAVAVLLYTLLVRPWHMRWGATDAEVAMSLPGDRLMAPGAPRSTRALTLRARADEAGR